MKRLSLEYGRTYEIPVTFESEGITNRLLHGVIHVKERISYLATLLETAYDACISATSESGINEKVQFNEKLEASCSTLSKEQLACIKKVAKKYCKPTPIVTYMDKLNALLEFQYDDCKLVDFTEGEKKYIKDNRNRLSHGASIAYKESIHLEKLLVLLLYTVLKVLEIPSHILRNRLVFSASVYLHSVNKDALRFFDAEKISISHDQFLELKKSEIDPEHIYCMVLESHANQFRVNLTYTGYFNRDHHHIDFLRDITDVLRCYYRSEDFKEARYVSGAYLIDEANPDEYVKPNSLSVVELKKPLEEVTNYLNDSLIPTAASDYARKEKIPILKAYRITKGLSIGELAQSTGLSTSTISRYENTYSPSDQNTYQKILKNLGTDISLIFEEQRKKQAQYKKTKHAASKKVRK